MPLDAQLIDAKLHHLFQSHVIRLLNPFVSSASEKITTEVEGSFWLLLWYVCVFSGKPTPGMTMLNLFHFDGSGAEQRKGPSNIKRVCLAILWIASPWMIQESRRLWAINPHGSSTRTPLQQKIYPLMRYAHNYWCYARIFNLIALISGNSFQRKYLTLSERLVGMDVASVPLTLVEGKFVSLLTLQPGQYWSHAVPNFQFQNRSLLWGCLTAFSALATQISEMFLGGMVVRVSQSEYLRNISVLSILWWRRHIIGGDFFSEADSDVGKESFVCCNEEEELWDYGGTIKRCAVCRRIAGMPYQASCGHFFCYYCIRNACMKSYECKCILCNSVLVLSGPISAKSCIQPGSEKELNDT